MTEQDGFADTPGREATPEEEARVQALLASLRDDDVPMPDHVWSRLSAVIAEEHVAATARQISGAPTALGGSDDPASGSGTGVASVTVLPTPEQRARRGAPRWLLPAAAAAVVVLLAGGLVKGLGTGSGSSAGGSVTAAQESAAPTQAASAESHSNFAYTQQNLGSQVGRLVTRRAVGTPLVPGSAGGYGTDSSAGSAASPSPSTSTTEQAPLALTESPAVTSGTDKAAPSTADVPPLLAGAALTACVAQLTGDSTTAAVAVDRGTWQGQPADIVVIPTENDPTTLDVWVLAPGCTASNADVLHFSRIARP